MSGEHKIYKNNRRLNDMSAVRKYLARTLNAYDDGRIESQKLRDITYLCKTLMKALESENLEERVEELEQLAEKEAN